MRLHLILSTVLLAAAAHAGIITRPASFVSCDGQFAPRSTSVLGADKAGADQAQRLAARLVQAVDAAPRAVATRDVAAARRRFALCGGKVKPTARCRTWLRFGLVKRKAPPPEGYSLDVSPGFVRIRAADTAGIFYGAESLRQLLPA